MIQIITLTKLLTKQISNTFSLYFFPRPKKRFFCFFRVFFKSSNQNIKLKINSLQNNFRNTVFNFTFLPFFSPIFQFFLFFSHARGFEQFLHDLILNFFFFSFMLIFILFYSFFIFFIIYFYFFYIIFLYFLLYLFSNWTLNYFSHLLSLNNISIE